MALLRTSDGSIWDVALPTASEEHSRLDIHTVRDSNGTIVKPSPNIYAEILAAQLAYTDIVEQGVAFFEESRAQAAFLDSGAEVRIDQLGAFADNSLLDAAVDASIGVALGIGLGFIAGPGGAIVGGVSGAFVGYTQLVNSGRISLLANEVASVHDRVFSDIAEVIANQNSDLVGRFASQYSSPSGVLSAQEILSDYQILNNNNLVLSSLAESFQNFDNNSLRILESSGFSLLPPLPALIAGALTDTASNSFTRFLQPKLTATAAVLAEVGADIESRGGKVPGLNALIGQLQDSFTILEKSQNALRAAGVVVAGFQLTEEFIEGLSITGARAAFDQEVVKLLEALSAASKERDAAAYVTTSSQDSLFQRAILLPIFGSSDAGDVIEGTSGDDIIDADLLAMGPGTGGDDVVRALAGSDKIIGGPGNDVIDGGPGNDLIEPGAGLDQVITGAGDDVVAGSISDLHNDFVALDFGDVIEISDAMSLLPEIDTSALSVDANGSLAIDFDGDGNSDLTIRSGLTGNLRPVVQSVVDDLVTRTVSIRIGDSAAFVIDQPLNAGFASMDQASLGGMTAAGETFSIGLTNIHDGPSDPELRNLAVTDTGSVFTVFEYDAGENLSFGLENALPPQFPGDVGGVIVELDPETGAFIDSTIRAFAFGSGGSVPNTPPDFGVTSVESINALAPLGGGEFLAIAEFNFRTSDPIRTLEGGSDFAFKIDTSGNTDFLVNWSVFGDGDGTRTIAADTSPITGQVYAWRDFSNSYGGGSLLEVDRNTGEPTVVASFGVYEITSIAFQSDGTLIGIGGDEFGRGTIFEIDPVARTIVPVQFITGEFFPREFDLFGDFQFKPETNGTSDDDSLGGSEGDDYIDGGLGNDSLSGLGGNDDIFAGGGTDVINPGLGSDVVDIFGSRADVRGTLSELDGDRIRGFDQDDTLTFLGTAFALSNISVSLGSLIISVDADGDGTVDSVVTLDGEFEAGQPLVVEGDGEGNTTIRLGEVNVAPVAADDAFAVLSNEIAFGNLLANDTDGNSDELSIGSIAGSIVDPADTTVQIVDLPSGAQIAFLADGSFIYDPRSAFSGLAEGGRATDTISYVATDGVDSSPSATVTIEVSGAAANVAPAAVDDGGPGFETDEDSAFITGNVLDNDTDADGGTLSVSSLDTTGTLGLVTDNGDGTFDYDPNGAFESLGAGDSATDSFFYTVSDGDGGTDTAMVTIAVDGANDGPVAADDSDTTEANTPIDIDVLGNDNDVDGDTLSVSAVGVAGNGTTAINPDGTIRYTPNSGFEGTDSFTYTVSDDNGGNDSAMVTVTVSAAPNQPPVVSAIMAGLGEDDTGRTVNLLDPAFVSDPDGDELEVESVTVSTADGRLLSSTTDLAAGLFFLDDGQFEDLADGALFAVTIDYYITDGVVSVSNMATLTITGANDSPIAVDDGGAGFDTDEDSAFTTANVLENDSDVDGDTLSVSALDTTGTLGSVTDIGDGTFGYDPGGVFQSLALGESTTDSFSYTLADGMGRFAVGVVTIEIEGVNDNPTAGQDSFALQQDDTLVIPVSDLIANDTDVDGDAIMVTGVSGAMNGIAAFDDKGDGDPSNDEVVFTPTPGFSGEAAFNYSVSDGIGGVAVAAVSVTVTPSSAPLDFEAGSDVVLNEGATLVRTIALTDGSDDGAPGWNYTIDYGDGTLVSGLAQNLSLELDHIYADGDASRTVSITVTDEAGETARDSFIVAVANIAPTLELQGTDTVDEGNSYTLTLANLVDPGADTVSGYSIDWGDGSSPTVVANLGDVDHVFADDGAFSIRVTATDEDGSYAFTKPVAVANVAPTLDLIGADTVDEGSPYTLTLANLIDPGVDTVSGYSIDWGDGSTPTVVASLGDIDHTFADDGDYTITVTATDEDGNYTFTKPITVANVAPEVTLSGADGIDEGSTYQLGIEGVDPGIEDTLSFDIDWGDGSAVQTLSAAELQAQGAIVEHVFSDDEDGPVNVTNRSITVTARDGDGGVGTASRNVAVSNVAPLIALSGATSIEVSASYTLTLGAITDPGLDIVTSFTIDWGDGSSEQIGSSGPVTHIYAGEGPRTIVVSLDDEDGTHANAGSLDVLVTPADPGNTAPVANADSYSVYAGRGLSVDAAAGVLANDSDADGDALSVVAFQPAANGVLDMAADGSFAFAPNAGFTGTEILSYTLSDGTTTVEGTLEIVVEPIPVETVRIGDAPTRLSRTNPDAWETAWSHPDIEITHKAVLDDAQEDWSPVVLRNLSPLTLAGGDSLLGDLGVSGQTLASSAVRQELDGTEGLRFELQREAVGVTADLSRFFLTDDGTVFAEAGRIQFLDADGTVLGEHYFTADSVIGDQTVSVLFAAGFDAVAFSAGALNGNDFVFGADSDPVRGSARAAFNDDAGQHGSEFMLDWIEFDFIAPALAIADTAEF